MTTCKPVFILPLIALLLSTNYIEAQKISDERQTLSEREQQIVVISSFTAKGDLERLNQALNNGLDAGLTINEIKEILVQLYAYTGFPRSLNALNTFMAVIKERKQKGINDLLGKEPSPLSANKNNLEFGTANQTKLIGKPVSGEVYQFAPVIDQFLKAHLFGDIFGRDNLDWKTRELATISALAALGGAEAQLRSHFGVSMYNGITEGQLNNWISIIETKVGSKEGKAAKEILQVVLEQKQGNTSTQDMKVSKTSESVQKKNEMLIRISEIEIYPDSLDHYKAILKEEAEASMKLEPGVISILPLYQKKDVTQVRILEVYANREAYESHLKTAHFQHYKTTTSNMVKSLQLIDMDAMDTATMTRIFTKLKD